MDDEFALCWNNFQDNIASGFQNLYDRGDLVDVTLACDGRLLHAHKIVLAICSPYFQEIFISNPCKHPIIILKDVTHGVMCELLQFMYQGVVNVKHTELQAFMKIAQLLQIKGLASSVAPPSKSPSQLQATSSVTPPNPNTSTSSAGGCGNSSALNQSHKHSSGLSTNESNNLNDAKNNIAPAPSSSSSTSSPSPMPFSHIKSPPENINPFQTGPGLKRLPEYSTESLSIYSRKQYRRNTDSSEHDMCPDSMDHVNSEDSFLPTIPHISMAERFDPNSVKRENNDHSSSPVGLRNSLPPHFGFDYNIYKNNPDYPSDLHLPNDYSKSFGNHMDIPPSGGNVTMLSSTSLLHANCVFNRNNTVATQQGMKTYWLCKSYRISMCRARCITHQGRVISATGVHNHPPHMRNVAGGLEMMPPQQGNSGLIVPNSSGNVMQIPTSNANLNNALSNIRLPQGVTNLSQHNLSVMNHQQQQQQQQQQQPQPPPPHHHHLPQGIPPNPSSHHQMHQNAPSHHHHHQTQHVAPHSQSSVIQNMMHNVNLMHLSNMAPMLNTLPSQHSPQMSSMQQQQSHHHQGGSSSHHQIPQPPSSLEITPILTDSPCVNSPSNRGSNPSHMENIDSPMHSSAGPSGGSGGGVALESPSQASDGNGSSHVPDATASLVPNSAVSPDGISNNCQDSHASSQHSHIISSITISPSSAHNFKIENM